MTVKKILSEFSKAAAEMKPAAPDEMETVKATIEGLVVALNRCFVAVILPSVFEIERDLHQAGFWNQLNIGQSTSLSSGKPNIKDVTFYFYPEKTDAVAAHRKLTDSAYRAVFRPTRDMRKIEFTIFFPKKIPPVGETETTIHRVETIDTATVDRFLEKFVKGTLDAYTSDRMFR